MVQNPSVSPPARWLQGCQPWDASSSAYAVPSAVEGQDFPSQEHLAKHCLLLLVSPAANCFQIAPESHPCFGRKPDVNLQGHCSR